MANILVSGYYGYGNFGDELILSILVDYLKRRNHEISVFSANPSNTAVSYGVKSFKNFSMINIINEICKCDVLISGGGSLLQDVTSLKSLLYYSLVILLAKLCNKKIIIFAQGIGPLRSNLAKKIVPYVLSKCDIVTVRDDKSLNYLKENKIRATLVSDPVFSVDLPCDKKNGTVGVQLRSFKNIDNAFLELLAKKIVEYFGDRKIELYVFQESLDYPMCKNFEKMLKKLVPNINTEIIHNLSHNDIITKISQLEFMIAMRFHAVLISIKTGVKTLAINYDAKVSKLAYEAMLPLLTLSSEQDLTEPFNCLINTDSNKLIDFSKSQRFDWTVYNDFI